ncbi:MAG: ribonucleoside triphosphate reductase [Aminobacterium sp.]|uniref:ribonucleoside triphosphate reductase n=1 Tax=unclassified Aminobacterium TaxID=2685012 RepID=UPI001BCEA6DF|nr:MULTISPECIES: ribonucleoside triphosphate reductase [unclassified Aminobacterium]MDD2205954.1 ribonucleoside triphosphate reductase [Aminobacterium sp.]MDD3425919.1 ribonucleoside triphosphate reductase [Aminobacterium sp.]MDD3707580.1 ribonucleoside triphosphate reductase [Aminobacterium sp.]MDD4227889.1 ribonucleoside triphosphate reductase [Aminobacterium sp.]MDD4550671.1 ribonucleoside triphosphate reductase [Aminobacterium sp.]
MIHRIRKRDGHEVPFDEKKITTAVMKAAKAVNHANPAEVGQEITRQIVSLLEIFYKEEGIPTVEQVQDLVEKFLIEKGYASIAKAYILYREQHAKMRDTQKLLGSAADMINKYLKKLDWKVNENSNMSYSLQGLNNYIASELTAQYWLQEIYSPRVRERHIAGDLHIHDLSNLSVYCCGWDLYDLLVSGFTGVQTKMSSKPAKHFRSLLGQIVNFFYTMQGESAGAQAFSNFDTYLAPFIYYDNLTYREVKQALQEFIFNLNVPTRVGFQTPFTNITMDLIPPAVLGGLPAIVGGQPMDKTYKDFQKEMDMLNCAFAEVMLEGDATGKVFPFPIPTYNITQDFDWNNDVLNSVWDMTARYGIPYFSNFINSDMSPDDARSMCCRLRLDNRELRKRGGGLFGSNPMTGSIGVVTLNMPRIGYLAKDEENFLQRTFELMDIAKESLEIKRKILERLTDANLYPYSKFYLRSIREETGMYWNNHFNTIGINGMNEALMNFMGKTIADPEGMAFATRVMTAMRQRLSDFQEETGNLYNLEATPAEGTSYRFARLDKDRYGNSIIAANEDKVRRWGAEPYYTNSTQLPVGYTDDIFEALELQDNLQTLYTGGTVFHGFLGESMPSGESTKRLVRKIAENFHLPYFTITPTFSICPIHGYIPGAHEYCPYCDAENGYEEEVKTK